MTDSFDGPVRREEVGVLGLPESVRHHSIRGASLVDIDSGRLLTQESGRWTSRFVTRFLSFADFWIESTYVLAGGRAYGIWSDSKGLRASAPLIGSRRRFNDGTVERNGFLVVGTMNLGKSDFRNRLFLIDENGSSHVLADGLGLSNGVVCEPTSGDLFFADTLKRTISRISNLGSSGSYGKPEVVLRFNPGEKPDGILLTQSGELFVAIWGKGIIKIVDLRRGLMRSVKVPPKYVTSLALSSGGRLYFAGKQRLGPPASGSLWSVATSFRPSGTFSWNPGSVLLSRLGV